MKKIPLSQGLYATVDAKDYDFLMQWKWTASFCSKRQQKVYAIRRGQKNEGKLWRKRIAMHRVITNCPVDLVVDHLNGDGLDNRRCNLEIVDQKENVYRNFAMVGNWIK